LDSFISRLEASVIPKQRSGEMNEKQVL